MVRLAVVLKSFERTHDFYKSKIISDDVFYDTIKDAAVWCENNQNNGLKNYRWLHNHASGKLFKIGRLQFQMYKAPWGQTTQSYRLKEATTSYTFTFLREKS